MSCLCHTLMINKYKMKEQNQMCNKCRTCLNTNSAITMTLDNVIQNQSQDCTLSEMLMECSSIQLSPDDEYPKHICSECVNTLTISYNFRKMCEKSADILKMQNINTTDHKYDCNYSDENDVIEKCVSVELTDNTATINKEKPEKQIKSPIRWNKIIETKKNIEKISKKSFTNKIYKQEKCELCDVVSENLIQLKVHMKEIHNLIDTYPCNYCRRRFFTETYLEEHMEFGHTAKQKSKQYLCTQCGKKFVNSTNLKQHMLGHSNDEPFKCTLCDKKFKKKQLLKSHLLSHSGERKFKCPVCSHMFLRSGALHFHLRMHTGEKRYACDVCEKKFSSRHEVKMHMPVHTGARDFPCELCGKAFTRKWNLISHIKGHTGEKNKICEICGAKYLHAVSLRKHMKKHKI